MSKKNQSQWVYIYMDTCGPCRRVTPLVDTMIATGINVKKYLFNEAPRELQRTGTPCLAKFNETTQEIEVQYGGAFFTGFFELYEKHKYLLARDISPIEFMVNVIKDEYTPDNFLEKTIDKAQNK